MRRRSECGDLRTHAPRVAPTLRLAHCPRPASFAATRAALRAGSANAAQSPEGSGPVHSPTAAEGAVERKDAHREQHGLRHSGLRRLT